MKLNKWTVSDLTLAVITLVFAVAGVPAMAETAPSYKMATTLINLDG